MNFDGILLHKTEEKHKLKQYVRGTLHDFTGCKLSRRFSKKWKNGRMEDWNIGKLNTEK